jgi:hypothetical protein
MKRQKVSQAQKQVQAHVSESVQEQPEQDRSAEYSTPKMREAVSPFNSRLVLVDEHPEIPKFIRIRDGRMRDCFQVPDGGKIRIQSIGDYTLEYLDPTHFRVKGGRIYHIDEFGERVNPDGTTVSPL